MRRMRMWCSRWRWIWYREGSWRWNSRWRIMTGCRSEWTSGWIRQWFKARASIWNVRVREWNLLTSWAIAITAVHLYCFPAIKCHLGCVVSWADNLPVTHVVTKKDCRVLNDNTIYTDILTSVVFKVVSNCAEGGPLIMALPRSASLHETGAFTEEKNVLCNVVCSQAGTGAPPPLCSVCLAMRGLFC